MAMARGARAERLESEERREQLLDAGVELLKRQPHEEVSIDEIAVAAGVSKGLLYHYFPTKKDFIVAALTRGQEELAERLRPDPSLPAEAQLASSLDAFLDYIEEHATAYVAIFSGRGAEPAYHEVIEAGRVQQLETLLAALEAWDGAPVRIERNAALETAAQGWLFFVEGAVLLWLQRHGLEREQLRTLLGTALAGSVMAAFSVDGAD